MSTKIFLHIPDDKACTVYRAFMPYLHCFSQLSENGIHITADAKTLKYEDFDVYIFNRLIRPDFYCQVVEPLLKLGKKFIWQCDDDLWTIPKWNPVKVLLDENDLASTNTYLDKCKKLWVSTKELATVANHPEKTKVLPNLVDLNQFNTNHKHDDDLIKIVWCGSASHDGDFNDVVEPIIKILEKYQRKIAVIFWGYLPTELANFIRYPGMPNANLVPKYENLFYGEWFSHREYFYKLNELKADIAIMPLDNCDFNQSKSNLKWLEQSLAGNACIATDLPPYQCVKHKETGLKVKSGDSQGWYDAIEELIENKEFRLNLNKNAVEQIRNEYSWQSPSKQLWLNAFLELNHI